MGKTKIDLSLLRQGIGIAATGAGMQMGAGVTGGIAKATGVPAPGGLSEASGFMPVMGVMAGGSSALKHIKKLGKL